MSASIATLSTQPAASSMGGGGPGASSRFHSTIVHRLFEGVLTSETRCLTCETVSSRDESFIDLSIDIEQNSSVTACLRQFSASEMLCQKNKFFCDSCCDLQEAKKRCVNKVPKAAVIHLLTVEPVGRCRMKIKHDAYSVKIMLSDRRDSGSRTHPSSDPDQSLDVPYGSISYYDAAGCNRMQIATIKE